MATGEDNIPAEFIQCCGAKGIEIIILLINKIFRITELPQDFLSSIFILILKTLKATKYEDHRIISLICKILLYIIKENL